MGGDFGVYVFENERVRSKQKKKLPKNEKTHQLICIWGGWRVWQESAVIGGAAFSFIGYVPREDFPSLPPLYSLASLFSLFLSVFRLVDCWMSTTTSVKKWPIGTRNWLKPTDVAIRTLVVAVAQRTNITWPAFWLHRLWLSFLPFQPINNPPPLLWGKLSSPPTSYFFLLLRLYLSVILSSSMSACARYTKLSKNRWGPGFPYRKNRINKNIF